MDLVCSGNIDGHNDNGARRQSGDQLRENWLLLWNGVQASALPRRRGADQCRVGANQNWQGDHRYSRHQWKYGSQKINDGLTNHYRIHSSSQLWFVSEIVFSLSIKTDTGMTPWPSRIRRLVTRNCCGRWDALEIKLSAAYSLSRDSFKVLFYNFKLIWPGQRYFWSSSSEGKVSKNCIRTKLHHCIASDAFQRSLPRNHRWKIWEREALYKTAKIYI